MALAVRHEIAPASDALAGQTRRAVVGVLKALSSPISIAKVSSMSSQELPTGPSMAASRYFLEGDTPARQDVLGGQVTFVFVPVAAFETLGVTVADGSPAQLAQRQAAGSQRWAAVIRDAGIKLD